MKKAFVTDQAPQTGRTLFASRAGGSILVSRGPGAADAGGKDE